MRELGTRFPPARWQGAARKTHHIEMDSDLRYSVLVKAVRGETANWGVVVPIGSLTVVLLGLLIWLLSTIRSRKQ